MIYKAINHYYKEFLLSNNETCKYMDNRIHFILKLVYYILHNEHLPT